MMRETEEENHAIFTLTGVPRDGYTLQQEIRAQLEEVNADNQDLREQLAEAQEEARQARNERMDGFKRAEKAEADLATRTRERDAWHIRCTAHQKRLLS